MNRLRRKRNIFCMSDNREKIQLVMTANKCKVRKAKVILSLDDIQSCETRFYVNCGLCLCVPPKTQHRDIQELSLTLLSAEHTPNGTLTSLSSFGYDAMLYTLLLVLPDQIGSFQPNRSIKPAPSNKNLPKMPGAL